MSRTDSNENGLTIHLAAQVFLCMANIATNCYLGLGIYFKNGHEIYVDTQNRMLENSSYMPGQVCLSGWEENCAVLPGDLCYDAVMDLHSDGRYHYLMAPICLTNHL